MQVFIQLMGTYFSKNKKKNKRMVVVIESGVIFELSGAAN